MQNDIFLSIIVADYDGVVDDTQIKRCLDSLFQQTLNLFEIILVHDGPRSRPDPLLNYTENHEVKCQSLCTEIRHNKWGHHSRDLGLQYASGQYVMFTNGDNIHYSDLVENLFIEANTPRAPLNLNNGLILNRPDILIFGVWMVGSYVIGSTFVRLNKADQQIRFPLWGFPPEVNKIDCMQFVMLLELWRSEGGWSIKDRADADGVLYARFSKKYGVRYIPKLLGEHW
jgi:glycosyltransferase involved in cell wall biosynthesis